MGRTGKKISIESPEEDCSKGFSCAVSCLKGLLEKGASLTTQFVLIDKLFLEKYVKRFKEDSSNLLNLYEEKMSLQNDKDNNPCS